VTGLELAAGLSVLAGALVQSAVGFGFSLVCAPLFFAAAGPQQAVGLLTVLGLEANLMSLFGERRRPEPLGRTVAVLLACSLPGMLAGVVVLRRVDADVLQVVLTVVVFASLALQLSARHGGGVAMRAAPPWADPVAGLAAGALTMTTSTAGPPVVLLLLGRNVPAARVRDTLVLSFVGLNALGAAVLVLTGTQGAMPDAAALAALVPLTAVGQLAGRPLFRRLAEGRYELVLTIVLTLSALLGLLSALL
jgi:uncharacterized membrane protein YfcA